MSVGVKSMAGFQRWMLRLFSSHSASSHYSTTTSSSMPDIAVVTGAGSGIGRAVCNILSQRNVNVVAADMNAENAELTVTQLTTGSGLKHVSHVTDVSHRDSVTNLFARVRKEYDLSANMIVNCAGITRDSMMLKMTDEQFDQVMNVNVKGTFYPIQIGCRAMIDDKRPSGAIVNVSSTSGKYGNIGQVNYAASKSAIYGLTKSVAKEMAKYNIRCNAVVPGFIDTPMVKSVPEHLAQLTMMLIALKRKGSPEEVAEVIAFLASSQSSYVTGTIVDVSGGFFM